MIEVLRELNRALEEDEALCKLLGVYNLNEIEVPTIFDCSAPEAVTYPYIIHNTDIILPEENQANDRSNYIIDIYDYNESALKVWEISARIEKIFKEVQMKSPIIGVYRDYKERIDEDDRRVQHIHLEYTVRFGREDLI